MSELTAEFFESDPVICARMLIGCVFHWHGSAGKIVETEAYEEFDDPACHTWNRPGARSFIARNPSGTAYVYLNYGVHWLFNVLVKGPTSSGFVLFRALEPLEGVDAMRERRGLHRDMALCSGPGKLTRALGIDGSVHGMQFLGKPGTGIVAGGTDSVITGGRIGISRAVDRPWRFGLAGSGALSKKF